MNVSRLSAPKPSSRPSSADAGTARRDRGGGGGQGNQPSTTYNPIPHTTTPASGSRTPPTWREKLSQAQRLTDQAARHEVSARYADAFEAYVRAGELYLWLVKNVPEPQASTSRQGRWRQPPRPPPPLPPTDEATPERLRKVAAKVLQRAEKIKASKADQLRPVRKLRLSQERQSGVVVDSAIVNGMGLPSWTDVAGSVTSPRDLVAQKNPQLSPAQIRGHASLQRPLANPSSAHDGRRRFTLFDADADLASHDITQDVVSDCSLVAALQVAHCHDRRWGTKLAFEALHPRTAAGWPSASVDGKYHVRLLLNGVHRRVCVDDALPCDREGTPVCAAARSRRRSRPGDSEATGGTEVVQLWPAVVEKAYLLALGDGGYDFGGSNASHDLHALTGWIPERVGLQSGELRRERCWTRLSGAWRRGEVMVTLGTARTEAASRAARLAGLIPGHNYAVLDLCDREERRELLVSNPWRRGGIDEYDEDDRAASTEPSGDGCAWADEVRASLPCSDAGVPGGNATTTKTEGGYEERGGPSRRLRWMTWEDVCARFDALYLNWDPRLYAHRDVVHFALEGEPPAETSSSASSSGGVSEERAASTNSNTTTSTDAAPSPSAAVSKMMTDRDDALRLRLTLSRAPAEGDEEEEVVLHLARHVHGPRRGVVGRVFDAVHVMDQDGEAELLRQGRLGSQRYSDGAHQLVRIKCRRGRRSYTVIVSRQRANRPTSYTLSAYAAQPVRLEEMGTTLVYEQEISGSWSGRTAGGNVTFPTFVHNPQYRLEVLGGASAATTPIDVLLTLECGADVPAQLMLTWPRRGGEGFDDACDAPDHDDDDDDGVRVDSSCAESDVVASSGAYSYGVCVAEAKSLKPTSSSAGGGRGGYVLVVSAFEPRDTGAFRLRVQSSGPVRVAALAAEGSGMFARRVRLDWGGETRREGRFGDAGAAGAVDASAHAAASRRFGIRLERSATLSARLTPDVPAAAGGVRLASRLQLSRVVEVGGGRRVEVVTKAPRARAAGFTDAVTGSRLPKRRLAAGEYEVEASVLPARPGAKAWLSVYCDASVELRKLD